MTFPEWSTICLLRVAQNGEWMHTQSKAISVIHSEDDIQVYMRSFAELFTQRMGVLTRMSV